MTKQQIKTAVTVTVMVFMGLLLIGAIMGCGRPTPDYPDLSPAMLDWNKTDKDLETVVIQENEYDKKTNDTGTQTETPGGVLATPEGEKRRDTFAY